MTVFLDDDMQCSCPSTSHDYDNLVFYMGHNAQCNNVFSRNPQLLIINAVLSVVCFLSSLLISFVLCTALGWTWFKKGSTPAVRDFTILIEETQQA
ncbi:hypothetical protein EON65_10320 [archaeon]|nr:MAG: hypothetical protein EON65_10320 [archaeon]